MSADPFQISTKERDDLVKANRGLVRGIAVTIRRRHRLDTPLEELIADGEQGLVEAANRFDPRSLNSFQTFATYRIRGAIFDGLRRMGVVDRMSYRRVVAARRANEYLAAVADERVPPEVASDEAAVAERVEGTIAGVSTIVMLALEGVSEGALAQAAIGGESEERPGDPIWQKHLAAALSRLSQEERSFMRRVYVEDVTFADIARETGRSKVWMTRHHARIIKKLRDSLGVEAGAT